MPASFDVCGALVAPAADAVQWRLFPTGRAVHEPPGMLCRMPAVVQHESPELALPDVSLQVLASTTDNGGFIRACRLSIIPQERL